MNLSDSIRYVGVTDNAIDLFESQYPVAQGVTYNSYVVIDEQTAVIDSVEKAFGEEWLNHIRAALGSRQPDYLIVQHMEPDHSANISAFMASYPHAVVVASAKAFDMMKNFFGSDYAERRRIVKEGDKLSLGAHTLSFIGAPMVHWPEVIVTYEETEKVLFSADAFGRFGPADAGFPWEDEARRYYIGIVGKYGAQVQALLRKAAALDIAAICPLHGPVLTGDLSRYLELYDVWSSYRPQERGVTIAYTSIYGNTGRAAHLLARQLRERGTEVALFDLARDDKFAAVASAFRYDRLVLATTTYNTDIFPAMKTYIHALIERGLRGRTVALIENGSWAPTAAKVMRGMLEGSKDIALTDTTVTLRSGLSEASLAQISALADELTR